MEKIPSTLILHKRPDGADTSFASLRRPLADSPLQQWLGAVDNGKYQQAPALNNFAFDRVKDLWDEPVDDSDDDSEREEEDPEQQAEPDVARRPARMGRRQALTTLYEAIEQSTDKICFIQYQPDGQTTPRWFLVQVNLEQMDPVAAKQQGIYWVYWLIQHYQDCLKLPTGECRYWPEVHERTTDPKNPYGPIIPVRPGRHRTILRQGNRKLYEDKFELATNLLHGPVNYQTGGRHVIPIPEWEILSQKAALKDIDT
jgi:hypothetical protein